MHRNIIVGPEHAIGGHHIDSTSKDFRVLSHLILTPLHSVTELTTSVARS
jgi:hypothetical protein